MLSCEREARRTTGATCATACSTADTDTAKQWKEQSWVSVCVLARVCAPLISFFRLSFLPPCTTVPPPLLLLCASSTSSTSSSSLLLPAFSASSAFSCDSRRYHLHRCHCLHALYRIRARPSARGNRGSDSGHIHNRVLPAVSWS